MEEQGVLDHVYAVIMAGGRGERFWPISTDRAPKPFIKIIDNNSLIQLTVKRIEKIIPPDRIFIVLGRSHLDVARHQLIDLPDDNFIIEPEGRDTAACIGFSAISLSEKDKDAVMVTLPADQYVLQEEGFNTTISNAVFFAKKGEYLVTIGIKPSRPETGYGYIRAQEVFGSYKGTDCYKVERFVEKPDFKTAETYVMDGNYFWNGGIFVWKVSCVLKGIESHMPELFQGLMMIRDKIRARSLDDIDAIYKSFIRKSIDYGLMEKADNVLMVKGEFIWDDIGTWQALLRVLKTDEKRNYIYGDVIPIDIEDSVVFANKISVGVIGVSNIIVVASEDGVLVCNRERSQEVREIAKRLEAKKKGI